MAYREERKLSIVSIRKCLRFIELNTYEQNILITIWKYCHSMLLVEGIIIMIIVFIQIVIPSQISTKKIYLLSRDTEFIHQREKNKRHDLSKLICKEYLWRMAATHLIRIPICIFILVQQIVNATSKLQ